MHFCKLEKHPGKTKGSLIPGDGFRGALEALKNINNHQLPQNLNGFSLVPKGQLF